MKLHHRVTGTLTAAVFALTSLAPAQAATTPPQIKAPKTPPTVKAPPTTPKVPAAPKVPVVKTPVAPKVPAVPKVQAPPKIPVVKTPTTPKVPVVKTPSAPKTPVIKVPSTVKTPPVVKLPTVTTPKIPATSKNTPPAVVKAPVKTPATKTDTPVKVKTPAGGLPAPAVVSKVPSKATDTASSGPAVPSSAKSEPKTVESSAPPPTTRMTVQGGKGESSDKGKDGDGGVIDRLAALGFTDKEAAKISTDLQNPATRAAAEKAVQERADIEADRQLIGSLVGEEKANELAGKLINPATSAATRANLRLVVEAAANLQLAGVDADKAARITDGLIRTGETDPKVANEIVGRVIIKNLTGQDAPQGDPDSDKTALDLVKTVLDAKASLQLTGAADDDKAVAKAIDDIVKNRVTDPKKAREIVEVAAITVLEEQGILPSAKKPGESLKDRLQRAAEEQKESSKPKEVKKPIKKPTKEPKTLAESFKGRLAGVLGATPGDGAPNPKGSSPSTLELVFGNKRPRTNAPKGVKDGKLASGGIRGRNVEGVGKGKDVGKGKGVGIKGVPNGNIAARPGQVNQGVGTGTKVAVNPDPSTTKDPNRPAQPPGGNPLDKAPPPPTAGTGQPATPGATGNAAVDQQDLDSNPQQSGSTTPAGSNMDSGSTTFTVTDAPSAQADGTTTVGFDVSGSPGGADDGHYVTTYYPDGTYTTDRVNADGSRETVGAGTGTPPNVQQGDSTNVTQGDQAVFAGDESGDEGNNNNNGGGGGGNGDGNGDDDGDGNKDNNNNNGDANATADAGAAENAPADAAEENDDTAEASQEGTPNPEAAERGGRSGRLAEATQGRVGGDEQRRQNKGLDQRKNGNGAAGPNPEGDTASGVLFTPEEQQAFATLLGMKRGGGVTTPTEDESSAAITDRDLKDIAARRGSLINPATGEGKGGSGQGFGKGGFTPGPAAPAGPAPKGGEASAQVPVAGAALGGNAQIAVPAAANAVKGAGVRVESSQVQQNVGR